MVKDFQKEFYEDILIRHTREERALKNIKSYIDAYKKGTIHIVDGDDAADAGNHTYSKDSIIDMVENIVLEGLGMDIPREGR